MNVVNQSLGNVDQAPKECACVDIKFLFWGPRTCPLHAHVLIYIYIYTHIYIYTYIYVCVCARADNLAQALSLPRSSDANWKLRWTGATLLVSDTLLFHQVFFWGGGW